MVLNTVPVFSFPEPEPGQRQQPGDLPGILTVAGVTGAVVRCWGRPCTMGQAGGEGGWYRQAEAPHTLPTPRRWLCLYADAAGRAVLMASYNGEGCIRLWELPTFAERGTLSDVNNARAMAGFVAGRLLVSGDEHGRVKVWRWKEAAALAAP